MFTRERAAASEGNVRERICADIEERVILVGLKCLCLQYLLWKEHRIFFVTNSFPVMCKNCTELQIE
jgi:hypothetical protein